MTEADLYRARLNRADKIMARVREYVLDFNMGEGPATPNYNEAFSQVTAHVAYSMLCHEKYYRLYPGRDPVSGSTADEMIAEAVVQDAGQLVGALLATGSEAESEAHAKRELEFIESERTDDDHFFAKADELEREYGMLNVALSNFDRTRPDHDLLEKRRANATPAQLELLTRRDAVEHELETR